MNHKTNQKNTAKPKKTAIALQYDGFNTPRVTATGQGVNAEQIMNLARQYDVPLHEDAGLALALSSIPMDSDIPSELYLVVAEILAFIYFLDECEHSYAPDDCYPSYE